MEKYRCIKLSSGDKYFLSPETPLEEISKLNKKFFIVKEHYSTPKKNKWWQFWKKKNEPMLLGYEVIYIGENFYGVSRI